MKKKLLVVVLLGMFSILMGQEKSGAIIGTFGLGQSFYTENGNENDFNSISFDVDVISSTGFSLAFVDLINCKTVGNSFQNIYVGLGYNFLKESFRLGLAGITSDFGSNILLGVKADATYWFQKDLGVTGSVIYGTVITEKMQVMDIHGGVSIRI
jgi:hypothetical protein